MRIVLLGSDDVRSHPLVAIARDDGHEFVEGSAPDGEAIWWLGDGAGDPDREAVAAVAKGVGDAGLPFLGCGTGQLALAEALGGACEGTVGQGARTVLLTEAGATGVLLDGVAEPVRLSGGPAKQVTRLPDGARCMASSDLCDVEAMLWGTRAFSTHAPLCATEGFDEVAAERIYINWFQAAARA